jgi:surface antigen
MKLTAGTIPYVDRFFGELRRKPVRRMKTTVVLIGCMLVLSGCLSGGSGQRSGSGMLALAGPGKPKSEKPVASEIIAAMDGGLIAGSIGQGLDDSERNRALEAEYKALEHTPNGQIVTWRADGSARYGEVVASQPYRVGSQDCRQYAHTVYGGGQSKSARGTACRNSNGSWTPLT